MKRRGFMCKVDFDHELGDAAGGIRVYPSVEDLQRCKKCCQEDGGCGIVEVEVTVTKVVRKDKADRCKPKS